MALILIYIMVGCFAGSLAGLLGIGGGLIVVPTLDWLLAKYGFAHQQLMHVAAGTSLAAMIFTTSSSVLSHYRKQGMLWQTYRALLPGIMLGVIVGANLADELSSSVLRIIFAVFMIGIACRMIAIKSINQNNKKPSIWVSRGVGFLVGAKSGLLGVGGGALTLPYLTRCHVPMHKAVGVTALCSLTVAMIGTVVFIIAGGNEFGFSTYQFGYVYWPAALSIAIGSISCAPLGARLAHKLSVQRLRRIFAIFLLLVGMNMLFR